MFSIGDYVRYSRSFCQLVRWDSETVALRGLVVRVDNEAQLAVVLWSDGTSCQVVFSRLDYIARVDNFKE